MIGKAFLRRRFVAKEVGTFCIKLVVLRNNESTRIGTKIFVSHYQRIIYIINNLIQVVRTLVLLYKYGVYGMHISTAASQIKLV